MNVIMARYVTMELHVLIHLEVTNATVQNIGQDYIAKMVLVCNIERKLKLYVNIYYVKILYLSFFSRCKVTA